MPDFCAFFTVSCRILCPVLSKVYHQADLYPVWKDPWKCSSLISTSTPGRIFNWWKGHSRVTGNHLRRHSSKPLRARTKPTHHLGSQENLSTWFLLLRVAQSTGCKSLSFACESIQTWKVLWEYVVWWLVFIKNLTPTLLKDVMEGLPPSLFTLIFWDCLTFF